MIGMVDAAAIQHQLDELSSENPRQRANMLRVLGEYPRVDARVLTACERLLADDTITLLGLPYRFGEVRAVAAEAVWAIRVAMGSQEPVVVEDALPVYSTNGVAELAKTAGIAIEPGGVDGVLATLVKLAAAGKVPRKTISLLTDPSRL